MASGLLAAYWRSHWKWAVRVCLAALVGVAILTVFDHRERKSAHVDVQQIRGSQP